MIVGDRIMCFRKLVCTGFVVLLSKIWLCVGIDPFWGVAVSEKYLPGDI